MPQNPSLDFVGSGCPVAYVDASEALPEVLADAGEGALDWAAEPLPDWEVLFVAGVLCAIAGALNDAASRIAAIDPGVNEFLFTRVPFGPLLEIGKWSGYVTHFLLDFGYSNWLAKMGLLANISATVDFESFSRFVTPSGSITKVVH